MTEGDKAFYKRRLREELKKARIAEHPRLRNLHLQWAKLYEDRLDGVPRSKIIIPPAVVVIEGDAFDLDAEQPRKFSQAA
jgi:hypothetical protein